MVMKQSHLNRKYEMCSAPAADIDSSNSQHLSIYFNCALELLFILYYINTNEYMRYASTPTLPDTLQRKLPTSSC